MSDWLEPTVIRSTEAVADFFQETLERCQRSIDIMVKGSQPFGTAHRAEQLALAKGIRARCIYERSLLRSPGGQSYLQRWREEGEQQRVLDSVPLRAGVVDRSLVIVPTEAEGRSITSLLVVRAGLGEAFAYLFDMLWESRPVLPRAARLSRALTEQETAILALMCEGAPDRKIAKELNISNRTVQRRLQEVSGLLGAESRAALAARAVALGLATPFK